MTREQKIEKRKARAEKRKAARNKKYRDFIHVNRGLIDVAGFSGVKYGAWADSNSPTGYSQVCSYEGICQSPCNGDC